MDDYPTVTRRARTALAGCRRFTGRTPFGNRNPITPDVLAVLEAADGTIVEISTGVFLDVRLYGITTNSPAWDSHAVHSWSEVLDDLAQHGFEVTS